MMVQVFNLFCKLSMTVLVVEDQTEKMVSKCLFLWVYSGILLVFLTCLCFLFPIDSVLLNEYMSRSYISVTMATFLSHRRQWQLKLKLGRFQQSQFQEWKCEKMSRLSGTLHCGACSHLKSAQLWHKMSLPSHKYATGLLVSEAIAEAEAAAGADGWCVKSFGGYIWRPQLARIGYSQAGHWVDIIDHWSIIDHFA